MRSVRLRALDRQIRHLRSRYLPRNFSPTGNYSNDVYLDTAAFLLLCHAEFETYFEQLIFEKVARLLSATAAGASTKPMETVLAILFNQTQPAIPCQISEIRADAYRKRTLMAAAHAVRLRAEGNQGVKAANLLPLLVALGLDETGVDQDLLRRMDEIGRKRGQVAHHALHDMPLLPDPKESRLLVYDILGRLKALEAAMP